MIQTERIGALVLQHLPDTIQTFSNSSKKTVSSLIQNIKSDKTQISKLIENIRAFDTTANYTAALALRYSPMNIEAVIEFFRDSSLRVGQFFSASSSISNVVNSMVALFSSEIQKIENDIKILETFIDNYQYISGEDDLFNFNYVENFDNDINSYKQDSNNTIISDRDGVAFPQNGNYQIDKVISKMTIANGISFANIINNVSSINYTNNYSNFITTDTGFNSTMNESLADDWTVTVKSPYVLTAQMPLLSRYLGYDYSYIRGAQAQVVVTLLNAIDMDLIRVSPSDAQGMQLLQVIIESTNPTATTQTGTVSGNTVETPVLSSPLLIDKTVDVLFPKCKVSKITFIFNQSKYTRSENIPNIHETNSKYIHSVVQKIRDSKSSNPSRIQDLVYFYFKNNTSIPSVRKNKKQYEEIYSFRYPSNEDINPSSVFHNLRKFGEKRKEDSINSGNNNIISNIVQTIVQYSIDARSNLFKDNIHQPNRLDNQSNQITSINSDGIVPLKNDRQNFDFMFQKEDPEIPGITSYDLTNYLNSKEITSSYEYSFSIKNISFGVVANSTSNKACYISKKIQTDGAPLGLKGIVNIIKERQNLNYNGYDLVEPGSVELSICVQENILGESSWIPINHTQSNRIDSEVLFFNNLKQATLRFLPLAPTIRIYKNGILENPNNWTYQNNKITMSNLIEPLSIYVAQYNLDTSDYNQSLIDIDRILGGQNIIRSYVKNGSQGQVFESTGGGNRVQLDYIPFIESKFSTATYSSLYGTINSLENIGYSPIKVTLSDGTLAINLTNYLNNNFEKATFYSTNEVLFFQNGKQLIFNKNITTPLTVNYSYIPSSIRFRTIIRNNIPSLTNGISLDSVIIKCKVNNLDPLSQKLLRLN
jgi:hypothetical protein